MDEHTHSTDGCSVLVATHYRETVAEVLGPLKHLIDSLPVEPCVDEQLATTPPGHGGRTRGIATLRYHAPSKEAANDLALAAANDLEDEGASGTCVVYLDGRREGEWRFGDAADESLLDRCVLCAMPTNLGDDLDDLEWWTA